MIKVIEDFFVIETKNTSYVFYKHETGLLIHLYYGKKISSDIDTLKSFIVIPKFSIGTDIKYTEKSELQLENMLLEIPSSGNGDTRQPMFEIENSDGFRTTNFLYESYELNGSTYNTLPNSRNITESITITLNDNENGYTLKTIYNVFENVDVISRQNIIINNSSNDIKIVKAYSLSLDMKNDGFNLRTFNGHWANEFNPFDQKIVMGTYLNESKCGVSSNRSNPFIMVYKDGTSELNGEVFAFNLIYSGNHQERIETNFLKNLRIQTGINPDTFSYTLKPNEVFEVPEAIMTYSSDGFEMMSHNLHDYINNNIIDPNFKEFPRHILNNSWEACTFNFNERKIVSMAKEAKRLGVELFVLDDGWFKNRNSDQTSLGDWVEDKKKLPHGLKGLSDKIHKNGLEFGIWVEPEMVSEKSDLYNNHPEWVIKYKNNNQSLGRHQYILDLTNNEVIEYLYNSLKYVFSESKCEYVKWDMNRIFSDIYSNTLDSDKMTEFNYRYYQGLYKLLGMLKEEFSNILFESCASGGNRVDLGMLYYMPQVWASDNTDPFVRIRMQMNYSYGYPISAFGTHSASSPCANTLRRSTIETRFNVAYMGAFGYEIDLREESKRDKETIKKQTEFYKNIREKLVGARFRRIFDDGNKFVCSLTSLDQELSIITEVQYVYKPINSYDSIKVRGLNPEYTYRVYNNPSEYDLNHFGAQVNYISPIHIKDQGFLFNILRKIFRLKEHNIDYKSQGNAILYNGLNINESFSGAGFYDQIRFMLDFDSKMYIIERVNDNEAYRS